MIEVTGLNDVVSDFRQAGRVAAVRAVGVVHRGSANVMRDAKRFSSGLSHAPHYPASISYDVYVEGSSIVGEIGPASDRPQGPLGPILEYGTANNAPFAHLGPALDIEGPKFEKALGDLL